MFLNNFAKIEPLVHPVVSCVRPSLLALSEAARPLSFSLSSALQSHALARQTQIEEELNGHKIFKVQERGHSMSVRGNLGGKYFYSPFDAMAIGGNSACIRYKEVNF